MSVDTNIYAAGIGGDREAFGEIVRQNQNLVSAVTFSMTGNVQQSEDLAQEAFIVAWQNLRSLKEPAKLPAWLCGIARNLTNNWIRRTQAERQGRTDLPLEEIPAASPSNETERTEQAALLWATLQEIPLQYREPLIMYYRQNQSVPEIAAALEISEDNVRQRIARGRAFLKEEVEHRVEQALEQLRPSSNFSVAVLAALPVLSVSTLAETTSAAVGTGAIGKGSVAGIGIGGFLMFLWVIVVGLFISVVGTIDGYRMGLNTIRNSPGMRSRRLTLLNYLWRTIVICFFIVAVLVLASVPVAKITPWGRGACFALVIGLCALHAYVNANIFYRIWCRTVKEELGLLPPSTYPIEKSWLSNRSLHCFFAGALVMIGVIMFGYYFLFVQSILHSASDLGCRPLPSGLRVFVQCFSLALLFFTVVPFSLFYRKALKLVSEKGLVDDPPLVSDFLNTSENSSSLLDTFLGLSKIPQDEKGSATRRRLELVIAAMLFLIPSFLLIKIGFIQSNSWPGYVSLLVPPVVFLLLAKFTSGKSAFRPIGWTLACFFMAGFNAWLAWGVLYGAKGTALPMYSTMMSFAVALQLFYGVVAVFTCLSRRFVRKRIEQPGLRETNNSRNGAGTPSQ